MAQRAVHRSHRSNWLRAAVLGANDGLISTGSLVMGMASAAASSEGVFLAALAGMVAGALSMAAGEYVSVSSQSDAEKADLDLEAREIGDGPEAELSELTRIYVSRGLPKDLAGDVAVHLTRHDALDAHAKDELGIHTGNRARPLQAALASAAAFAVGAVPPVVFAGLLSPGTLVWVVSSTTLVLLLVLGAAAARLGGASRLKGAMRVALWGALAMGLTSLAGLAFGTVA